MSRPNPEEQDVAFAERGRSRPGRGPWIGYLTTVLATFILLFLAYSSVIAALSHAGALPPPSIVNEVCADEKLEWLRHNPPEHPNLLVVGSSIAWRDVDSEQFVRARPGTRPLNGGVCHATVNQTGFVTQYLLRHLPSVRTVVAVLVPQDFEDCTQTPAALFDPATADAYVFDRRWSYRFYITQFDPIALARNAIAIRAMRDGRNRFDSMVMTRYGDGPLYTPGSRGLLYGKVKTLDPACFHALHDMARSITSGGRRLFVATGPVNPAWSARYDAAGAQHGALTAGIRAALQGSGARFWDGATAFAGQPADFTDAIHIEWEAARRYTAQLAAMLDLGHGPP